MFSGLQLTERNLVLTGYVEPNKPRIGRQIAEQLRLPFVDVEQRIEQLTGDDVQTIRDNYGERRLKSVETEIMEEVLLYRRAVIRVNGSTLMHSDHYEQLQATSVMICLVASLDSVLQRMHLALGARYHNPAERQAELGKLRREWEIRKKPSLYELNVTYKNEDAIIEDVLELWQQASIERA